MYTYACAPATPRPDRGGGCASDLRRHRARRESPAAQVAEPAGDGRLPAFLHQPAPPQEPRVGVRLQGPHDPHSIGDRASDPRREGGRAGRAPLVRLQLEPRPRQEVQLPARRRSGGKDLELRQGRSGRPRGVQAPHYEWESGTLPFFAWPTEGDRVTLWGSWIWDCGHWQTGKTTTGERTEFHPLNGIVVNRKDPYKTRGNESETDAFVSSDGNLAHAVEECALSHHPASSSTYDAGYRACVQSPGANQQPLASKYKFFVPAPPKPSPGATLHYRVVKRVSGTPATEKIKVRSNGLAVTVSLKSQPAGKTRRYGKSFFVSWTGAQQPAPTRLKVTFKTLTIKQADPASPKPSEPTSPWNVYLDLNGYWKFVNDWTGSKLLSVKNGQKIKLNKTVPIQVPAGHGVFLLMQGRECDEPAGQTVFGEHLPAIKPCPNELREFKLGNDDLGILLDTYKSPAAAIGTHKSFSVATTHKFRGSGPITFGNGIIGQHTFQLTYVVKPG